MGVPYSVLSEGATIVFFSGQQGHMRQGSRQCTPHGVCAQPWGLLLLRIDDVGKDWQHARSYRLDARPFCQMVCGYVEVWWHVEIV